MQPFGDRASRSVHAAAVDMLLFMLPSVHLSLPSINDAVGTDVINPILYTASRRQSSLIAHSICNALVNRVLFWYCCHIRDIHTKPSIPGSKVHGYLALASPHGSVAP